MKPTSICQQILGQEKIQSILEELSAPQIKSVLKEGQIKIKTGAGYVSQQKKRQLWSERIQKAAQEDDLAAGELLQQWLLHHRRPFLIAYLDALEVKHRDGETDETFLVTKPKEALLAAAEKLLETHDKQEFSAYLHYIAHQQKSSLFDEWDGFTAPRNE